MKQQDLAAAKEKISAGIKDLSIASKKLSSTADELFKTISDLEKILRNLNLRVSAWHQISRTCDDEGFVRTRGIGYTNLRGKWVIAINKATQDPNSGEYDEETWPFSEAPLWMCAEAVGHLPGLIEALIQRTNETTESLQMRHHEAVEILTATATAAAQIMTETRRDK